MICEGITKEGEKKLFLIYLGRSGAGPKLTLDFSKTILEEKNIKDFEILVSNKNKLLKDLEEIHKNTETIKTPTSNKELVLGSIKFIFNFLKKLKKTKEKNIKNFFFIMTHPWNILAIFLIKIFIKKSNVIYICHAFDFPTRNKKDFMEKIIIRLECLFSDKIVTLSTQVSDEIRKKFIKKDIHTLFHPLHNHKNISTPKKISNNPTFLLFGRILEYKGLNILLPAFSLLSKENKNVKLIIAGEGKIEDNENKSIKEINEKYNNIIINNNYIDEKEVDNIWDKVDISITPYLSSLQSGVIPIAINKATPSIITPHPALIEQCFMNTDNPIALCSKELSIDSVFQEMKNILNKETFSRLSLNCINSQKKLSWNNFVKKIILLLK